MVLCLRYRIKDAWQKHKVLSDNSSGFISPAMTLGLPLLYEFIVLVEIQLTRTDLLIRSILRYIARKPGMLRGNRAYPQRTHSRPSCRSLHKRHGTARTRFARNWVVWTDIFRSSNFIDAICCICPPLSLASNQFTSWNW
jgi:hypothetical protein